jgi:hypothetical protein
MKLYGTEKLKIIRLTINKEKTTDYLNLIDTTHEEVVKYLQNLFKEYTIKKGDRTTIDTRFCLGSTNGKSIRVSLYGISVEEVKEKIVNNLK